MPYRDRVVGHNHMIKHSTKQHHDSFFIVICVESFRNTPVAIYYHYDLKSAPDRIATINKSGGGRASEQSGEGGRWTTVPPCTTAAQSIWYSSSKQHSTQHKKKNMYINTLPMNPQCVYVCTITVADTETITPANQMASWGRGEH